MNTVQRVQSIVDTVGAWESVTVAPHRFGGKQFNLGRVELGHIHQHGMVDIPFTRAVREVLVAEGKAGLHHYLPDTGWITVYLRNDEDVQGALWLYQLSWLLKQRSRSRREPEQLTLVERDLLALNLSAAMLEVLKLHR